MRSGNISLRLICNLCSEVYNSRRQRTYTEPLGESIGIAEIIAGSIRVDAHDFKTAVQLILRTVKGCRHIWTVTAPVCGKTHCQRPMSELIDLPVVIRCTGRSLRHLKILGKFTGTECNHAGTLATCIRIHDKFVSEVIAGLCPGRLDPINGDFKIIFYVCSYYDSECAAKTGHAPFCVVQYKCRDEFRLRKGYFPYGRTAAA